jgi:hypothetical protein
VDTFFIVLLALAGGLVLTAVTGNPLMFLVAIITGAIVANRLSYRNQAKAIKGEIGSVASPTTAVPTPRGASERLAELDRLVADGLISEAEAAAKRKAIIEEI